MKASSGIDLMVEPRPRLRGRAARAARAPAARERSARARCARRRCRPRARWRASWGSPAGSSWRPTRSSRPRAISSSRQGAPTRVAARAAAQPAAAPPRRRRPPRFDFRPGAPDVALFPRTAWAAALRQGLRDAPDARLSYSDPRGPRAARRARHYLGRVRGVAADPAAVMVTSGLTQGLALTCRALAGRGVRRIAVEEPGSADLRAPIAAAGLEWVAVDVDGDGLDVTRSSAATRGRCSSRPPTSTPPASCSPRSGAPRCSRGRSPATPSCSRTTTTPSTATTASPSGRCRGSTRSASST